MTPAVLGSAVGTAALTFGRGATAAVGNGLSFAGELMKAVSGTSAASEEDKSAGDSARAVLTQRIAELRDRVRRQLAEARISLTKPVELASDGVGGIAVAADHPLHDAIQEVLGRDVLMERDFHQLACDYDEFVSQHGAGEGPATLSIVVPVNR